MSNSASHEFNLDYQALLNSMTDGLMCLDKNYQVLMVNKSYETLTGMLGKNLVGNNLLELYPKVKDYPFFQSFEELFKTKKSFSTTQYFPKLNKWIIISGYYQAGNMIVLVKDDTLNKQYEHSIQSYIDQIKGVMESMHTSFCLIGKNYEVLMFNKTISKNLHQYTGKYIQIGDSALEWTHPKFRDEFKREVNRALNGEEVTKEIIYTISDLQEPSWYYEGFIPVRNEKQEVIGVAFHAQNISALKKHETQASHFNLLYENILKATNEAVWEWNVKTNALKWNKNFGSIFGYTNEPITYTADAWEECIHPDDRKATLGTVYKAFDEKSNTAECSYRFLCKNGQYKYVIDRGYITYDENGEPDTMVGAMQDIQIMKEHEEQILQQNKTLAQIAHSQSHEVRGPVSTILGLIALLNKNSSKLDNETVELLQHLNKTAIKLDNIIKDSIHKIEKM